MKLALSILALAATAASVNAAWQTIASNVGTAATGIWFASKTVGFLPADENGAGAEIVKSTDGGHTWNYNEPHSGGLLFLDVTGYGNNVVVSGALVEEFSIDGGNHFNQSLGGGSGQCIRNVGPRSNPDAIAVVGEFGLFNATNGIAISSDGGIIFSSMSAGLTMDARYGAFPSANTFYVTAGDWPESNDDQAPTNDNMNPANDNMNPANDNGARALPDVVRRTPRLEFRRSNKGYKAYLRAPGRDAPVTSNTTTFQAQVTVSRDGGKTWTTVFQNIGDFYPNGIACQDEQNCCFCAEADAGPSPGAYIYCTTNGGTSWSQNLNLPGGQNSLMDIRVTGTTGEYWAVGGSLASEIDANATFWHSTNNGQSWTLDTSISGSYATAVDCLDSGDCWATTLQPLFQTASVAANNA